MLKGKRIGIDIGKVGGIAIWQDGNTIVHPMPLFEDNSLDIYTIADYIEDSEVVIIEEPYIPGGMANKGTKTAITDYGKICGIAELLSGYVLTVPPGVWKRALKLSKDKQESIDLAKQLFPDCNLKRTERSRVDCDGMAVALLILHYSFSVFQ